MQQTATPMRQLIKRRRSSNRWSKKPMVAEESGPASSRAGSSWKGIDQASPGGLAAGREGRVNRGSFPVLTSSS